MPDLLLSDYDTRTDGKVFNSDSLAQLYDAILGESGTGLYDKIWSQTAGGANIDATELYTRNGNRDIRVTFEGRAWYLANVTRSTNGKLIATLWNADSTVEKYQWAHASLASDGTQKYPTDVYGVSKIRSYKLNAGGDAASSKYTKDAKTLTDGPTASGRVNSVWAAYTLSSSIIGRKSFRDFIVQPKYVASQEVTNAQIGQFCKYICPNEAWGVPATSTTISDRYFNAYNPDAKVLSNLAYGPDTTANAAIDKTLYASWKEDYLWLPSWSEIGFNGDWNITATQRQATADYWIRSGDPTYALWVGSFTAAGALRFRSSTESLSYRQAFHLDLTAAESSAGGVAIPEPTATNTVYNASVQNISTLKPAWYDGDFYAGNSTTYPNAGGNVLVKYYKGGAAINAADIIDAGEYEAEFTLNNSNFYWRNDATKTVKTRRIKFTIKKKPLAVNFAIDSKTGAVQALSINPTDVYPRDGTLNLGVRYKGKASGNSNPSSAVTGYDSTVVPTIWGDYTAEAYIDVPSGTNCNYELTGTTVIAFTRQKDKAKTPTVTTSNATKTYDATVQQINITNFETTKVAISAIYKKNASGTYVMTSDVSWTAGNTYVEVKNAGEYRLEFSVSNDYVWSDGSANTDKKTVDFTVKQKELTVAVTNDEATNSWGWQGGNTINIKIAITGVESGDNIAYDGFYYDNASPATPVDTQAGAYNSASGAYEAALVVSGTTSTGTYTVNATLTAGVDETDNYVLPSGTGAALPKSFTVLAQNVNVSLLSWQVIASNDPTSTPVSIAENGTVKYGLYDVSGTATPITYTVQLDTTNFTAMYLLIDTSTKPTGYTNNRGSAVGTYTTTVDIKAADNDHKILDGSGNPVSSITLTLHWEIVKGDFDVSGIVWEYVDTDGVTVNDYTRPLSYADGLMYTLRVKSSSLPVGLTLNSGYTGMKRAVIGNHTAQLTAADVTYDTANFNAPDFTQMKLAWEITKKQIPLVWKQEKHSNTNPSGKDYNISVIDCDPAIAANIGYKYYDNTTGQALTLAQIDAMAVGNAQFTVKVEAYLISGNNTYMLGDGTTSDFTTTFEVGDGKQLATVTVADKGSAEYEAGKQYFTPSDIKVTDDGTGNAIPTSFYTVTYYRGTSADPANMLPAGEYPEAAGDYYIEIELTAAASGAYSLSKSGFVLTIAKQKVGVPAFTAQQFTGNDITLESCLTGFDGNLMEIVGDATGRNARTYSAIIRLKDTDNYEWDTGSLTPVSYIGKLAAIINGEDCELDWNIEKAVVKAEWKTDGEVPAITSLNAFRDLIDQQRLAVEYHYFDTATGEEVTELAGGKSYEVRAVLIGEDAENIIFEDTQRTDTKMAGTFTAPQNGFLAVMGNLGSMIAANWWWIIVALGILLFLILLIVLIKRRKKKKEEKQAKREAEEEKAEKKRLREEEEEEERQRRKRRREEEEEEERRRRKAQQEVSQQPAANPAAGAMAGTMAMPMAQPVIVQQPAAVQQPQVQPQAQAQPAPKAAERPKILIRQSGNSGRTAELEARVKAAEERAKRSEELLRKALDDRARGTAYSASRSESGYFSANPVNPFMPPESRAAEERARAAEERLERMTEERVRAAEERARMAEMQTVYANNRQPAQNNAPAAPQSSEIQMLEARLRAAEDRARSAEEHSRIAEERAMRAEYAPAHYMGYMGAMPAMPAPAQGIAADVVNALLQAAVKGLTNSQTVITEAPRDPRNVLPITFKAVGSENVDTSEEVAKVSMSPITVGTPTGAHTVPQGAVMTTTTTTTIDASGKKKQPERRELYDTDNAVNKRNN